VVTGGRVRRGAMWALAGGVAVIAAIVSYSHIYDLGRAHGGTGVPARLLPLSVDMLILVGELMLLHEADAKGRRFVLGWVLVWSGIGATLACNVAYGASFGVLGALIWGWPAYSFILAAGGMVAVVKRVSAAPPSARTAEAGTPAPSAVLVPDALVAPVAADAEQAAAAWYRSSLASGFKVSQRQIADQFGLPRSRAANLVKAVAAESNGHGGGDGG
jgi:hypothetical protein